MPIVFGSGLEDGLQELVALREVGLAVGLVVVRVRHESGQVSSGA